MLDFLKEKGYKHHHTSGDHIELKHDNGKIASVFGAGKLRHNCTACNLKSLTKQTGYTKTEMLAFHGH